MTESQTNTLKNKTYSGVLLRMLFFCSFMFFFFATHAQRNQPAAPPVEKKDSIILRYPIVDRFDVLTRPGNRFDLRNPSNIRREVEYDPATRMYTIKEFVGDRLYRMPQYLTYQEYLDYELELSKYEYWLQKRGSLSALQDRGLIPRLQVRSQVFDRIFGGSAIDIRPQGSAEITFGGRINRNSNPLFNERQRRQSSFNFDQRIQLNLTGSIGDKLKVTTNYNTEAQFDFENQIKFDFTGYKDDIIQKIEAGNVSLPINGTLINGSQALFGVKTQLKFGRLDVTTVISQQKSEQKQITISNGSQINEFRIAADNYDANRHYFLADFFRANYNQSLANLPVVNSGVIISKVEVWITNKTNTNTDARDIIAFIDLGENRPFNTALVQGGAGFNPLPSGFLDPSFPVQQSNNLLDNLPPQVRNSNDNTIFSYFTGTGGTDNFGRLNFARKLGEREYTLNAALGYISLNQALNADEVLAVAYRYTFNGVEYQVGEFSSDIANDPNEPTVLFTKLLKNETVKPNLPTWQLMMKNIYSLGAFQISSQEFKLDVFRLDESTGIEQPVIAEGIRTRGKTFLQLTNLDQINLQQSRTPDGIFDFIPGITIDPANGRLTFPVIEPFGNDLRKQFDPTETLLANKYVFQQLYDSTKFQAQQFPELNKYFFKGSYRSSNSSEFSLNSINIPQGSVQVTSGASVLVEGVDFTVDYNIGRVRIINDAILNSGQQINIKLESNELFGIQTKSLFGARFDYKYSNKLNLGGTILNLSERPLTNKVSIGDESVSNTIYGFDVNYRSDSRILTRLVDKLPFISTKETSSVTFNAEFAQLVPGVARAINVGGARNGVAYLDDFEGSRSTIDLKNANAWIISGTPQLFPESELVNDLRYGFNRARLAFYNIDPIFFSRNSNITPANIRTDADELSNHYVRQIEEREVFPNKPIISGQPNLLTTFDLSYYPRKRGPYNYTLDVNPDGSLRNPSGKWGGIFRRLETNDFETLNVEFIEFWVMDPFINNRNASGGDLYFNLGNISEDILKDGRRSIENGLPPDGDLSKVDITAWGRVAKLQPVTNSFDNDPNARRQQDVGLDGLSDETERIFFQDFINQLSQIITDPVELEKILQDPSSDNFIYYRGNQLDAANAKILERYRRYNGLEGNSKTNEQSLQDFGVQNGSSTPIPDGEDVNRDNTMSRTDEYFQYRVSIRQQDLEVGRNFISDKVTTNVRLANGQTQPVTWYQFKVPIQQFTSRVGGIQDFKSIRFMRMFMTGFEDTVILRFAKLQLLRGEWRRYNVEANPLKDIKELGAVGSDNSIFEVTTINLEENGNRQPIPYVLPPGIEQEQNVTSFRENIQQNEQALVLNIQGLQDGFARAAYKNIAFDFRQYNRLEMFAHAEGPMLNNGDVRAFIRLGSDFQDNYYEYEVPLRVTFPGTSDPFLIWPQENNFDILLSVLQDAKQARNNDFAPINQPYFFIDPDKPSNRVTVVGQPDLSKVRVIMIGVRNPLRTIQNPADDGLEKTAQIWVNELRLTGVDNEGGWAATARLNAKLADFANVTLSGSKSTFGFGSIDKKVNERNITDNTQFDVASSVELGKFFSEKSGIKIPMYVSFSQDIRKPEYNPTAPDIRLKQSLESLPPSRRDSLENITNDVITRRSINFTNVRKIRTNTQRKHQLYDIENFSFTYTFSDLVQTSYIIENNSSKNYRAGLSYNYQRLPKNIRPFDKLIKSDKLKLIKDFNFNLFPSSFDFRLDVDRALGENTLRATDPNSFFSAPTSFNRNFGITKSYGMRWDLTNALKLDYTAGSIAVVDEPDGRLDAAKRDTVMKRFFEGGRTTDFNQSLNFTYSLPISKIKALDWVNGTVRYTTQFTWRGEPLATLQNDTIELGNTISNARTIQFNPQLNLLQFYNKSQYLRAINNRVAPTKPAKDDTVKRPAPPRFGVEKVLLRVLMSLRNVGGSYSTTEGTFLPGYTPDTDYFGYDFNQNAPGLGFIFGSQKDIREKAARNGWITTFNRQNAQFARTAREDVNYRASIEPFRDFRIELTGSRTKSTNELSNFRFDDLTGEFQNFSPVTTGNFNLSIITLRTAFKGESGANNFSSVFKQFEQNRTIISQRFGAQNPFSTGVNPEGFADGYGRNSQDVVINSFLAAYLGKDAASTSLKQFPSIPLPNWRIVYNGLARLPIFSNLFSSININHSYRSTYGISSYNSLVRFRADENGNVFTRDVAGNFLPQFQVNFITISESFQPLFGADMRFKSNVTANFEYRKSRQLSFSLANFQLSQQRDNQVVLGMGYRTNKFKLPFNLGGSPTATTDLNMKVDVSYRSSKTIIYRVDVDEATVAGGTDNFTFRPSIDAVINAKVNFRIFYDLNITQPATSSSFKTSFANFGVSLRLALN